MATAAVMPTVSPAVMLISRLGMEQGAGSRSRWSQTRPVASTPDRTAEPSLPFCQEALASQQVPQAFLLH